MYPASEGFVATEDPRYDLLRIVPDHGIFFEFVPIDEYEDGKLKTDRPTRHTLANVETGVQYAVVVTTCAGLWAYLIGDTVAFERRDPPLIRFTGRTKYFLSAFGEHLISEEVSKAVADGGRASGGLAGRLPRRPGVPDRPEAGPAPPLPDRVRPPAGADSSQFADVLDAEPAPANEDYDAHRQGDLTMLRPEVLVVRTRRSCGWMVAHGRRLPQGKVPEMDNGGELTTSITDWLRANGEIVG